MRLRVLVLAFALVSLLLVRCAAATVTITDCASDPHCVAHGHETLIAVPDDTVVVAAPLVPLAGTATMQIVAKAIAIDGASGGGISATGKGRAIFLDAASVLVTGSLHSGNTNGTILLRGADTVQVQGPLDLDSGGDVRLLCTGTGCTLNVVGVRFHANHVFLDALGDIIWDADQVETFGPRDLVDIETKKGSIRKSGAVTVALARGRLVAEAGDDQVDAVSEAVEFCESCQQPTPTPQGTPTPPLMTASLPIGTPTPPPTATPTDPTPARTPTATRTPTPGAGTPTPIPTGTPCGGCTTVTGGVESTLFMRAAVDIDVSGDHYVIAEGITMTAGGNVDLTNAELRNDFGKCGDITITAGGQINVPGATLIDDDCRGKPDVSELNGREQVPHSGFNGVVGLPAVDD